ncbi:MAG: TIGR04222 domain-containing membrane protein, partial [Pseudonocardia sp.]|nr:TIGR04222 domain-containing membrane protein [Pseudonocardia sp.]
MGPNLSGATWGISGSTFLVVYAVIALVTLGAVLRTRHVLRAGRPVPADELDRHPECLAYLNGGRELAVYAALSAMHVDGSITTADRAAGMVRAGGPVPAHGSRLQRAIHAATTRLTLRRGLTHAPDVGRELDDIGERLVRSGLLLSDTAAGRYREVAFWMLAVLALGFVRAMAETANGQPVASLTVAMLLIGVAFLVLVVQIPRRTAAGDTVLAEQRERHVALSPSMRPDWVAVGAGAAALSVGVFGVGARYAAQPAFAEELAVQNSAALGGGG